jgi:hypothetical protein
MKAPANTALFLLAISFLLTPASTLLLRLTTDRLDQ